jgi:predicted ATPase
MAAHTLPTQLTTFIGRGEQINEIRQLLCDNRLMTLTGAGGAGKTRLAIEVAAQMTSQFPEGIWYADFAPITHPEVVPLAVARVQSHLRHVYNKLSLTSRVQLAQEAARRNGFPGRQPGR